jgi:hypothetical protein
VDFSFKIPALTNCGTAPVPNNQTPAPATPAGGQGADPGGDQAAATQDQAPQESGGRTRCMPLVQRHRTIPISRVFFSPKGLAQIQRESALWHLDRGNHRLRRGRQILQYFSVPLSGRTAFALLTPCVFPMTPMTVSSLREALAGQKDPYSQCPDICVKYDPDFCGILARR